MKVIQVYINNSLRNFNYILYSEKAQQAIVFDPTDLDIIDQNISDLGLKPKYLINTHDHYDHIQDNEKFLKRPNTEKIVLKDGEVFKLGEGEEILCRFTPGHVKEHYCYFLKENNKITGVISGDTVFNAGVGNTRSGGSPRILYQSIRDFFIPLESKVKVYPSHDYFLNNLNFASTVDEGNSHIDEYKDKVKKLASNGEFYISTIGEEKLFNPFFRAFEKNFQLKHNKSEEDLFVYLRSLRDKW